MQPPSGSWAYVISGVGNVVVGGADKVAVAGLGLRIGVAGEGGASAVEGMGLAVRMVAGEEESEVRRLSCAEPEEVSERALRMFSVMDVLVVAEGLSLLASLEVPLSLGEALLPETGELASLSFISPFVPALS